MQDIVDQQSRATGTTSCDEPLHTGANDPQVQATPMAEYSWECFCQVLTYSFILVATFLSAGIPYWYYCCHRPYMVEAVQADLEHAQSVANSLHDGARQRKLTQLLQTWKMHCTFIGIIFTVMFPSMSVSPLPKCSWAYVFAVIGMVNGLVALAICYLYGGRFEEPDESSGKPLFDAWLQSLQHGWFHKWTLRLCVLISFPTVWFVGFLVAVCMSILMIIVGERTEAAESPSLACPSGHMGLLRGFVCVTLLGAIASCIYVKSMASYFAIDEPSSE